MNDNGSRDITLEWIMDKSKIQLVSVRFHWCYVLETAVHHNNQACQFIIFLHSIFSRFTVKLYKKKKKNNVKIKYNIRSRDELHSDDIYQGMNPNLILNELPHCPAKTQISPGICPVWSESSLSTWRNHGSLATHWAHSEDWSDWAAQMLNEHEIPTLSVSVTFWLMFSVPKHLRHWHFDCCFQFQSIYVTDILSVGFSSKASTSLTFWVLVLVPKHLRHWHFDCWFQFQSIYVTDILSVGFSSKASTLLTFWLLFSVPKHLRHCCLFSVPKHLLHWHFECWFQFQSIYVTDILIQFQSIYITDILIVVFSCKASTSLTFWVLVSVPKHLRHWHFDCCFQFQSIYVTDILSDGFSSKASTSLTFWLLFSVPKHLRHCCYLSWNRVHCNLVRPKKNVCVSGFPTLPMFLAWS